MRLTRAFRHPVFAVNYDERQVPAQATLRIEALPVGSKAVVIDEDRNIRSDLGGFTDTFAPLAVHIYRIARE